MTEGTSLELIKVIYGLPTIGNRWYRNLLHTLREMGFRLTHSDPYVCIRGHEGGYEYVGTHINDVLIVAVNPTSIFNKLKELYAINIFSH